MAARHNHHSEHERMPAAGDGAQPGAGARQIRILMIEDVAAEAELNVRQLRRLGVDVVWQRVEGEAALRDALREFQPDVVLSDFSLPRFDGLSALTIVREMAPDVPFIFVSGTLGEERAIEALQCGAVDYVLKTNLGRLPPAINRAMQEAEARRERRRQEERIAHLTRVLRMLSGINGAVLRIRDRNELFDEACRLAVTVGGYATAGALIREPGTGAVQLVACAGVERNAGEQLREFAAGAAADTGIVASVLRHGSMFVCHDINELRPADAGSALLLRMGARAVVALPLVVDKTAIGVLMLTSPHTGTLIDEELQMLQEVAANLSFALQYLQKDSAVHFLSYFDPHTGLAKRALFCERLGRLQPRTSNRDDRRAVAVIDIEQLSVINDSFGRHIGDALLQHVADRLRRQFQYTELLAQFGGGIFAVAVDSSAEAADPARALKAKLDLIFARPFEIEGREIPVIVKSGLALYPVDGKDAATLVQNAEAALHKARASGQRFLQYSVEQHSEVVARLALEHKLRTAMERRQFELHYQPKVNTHTGRVDSVEGLIRWRDPESGLVAPDAFLPLLESTGLIVEVGEWVIGQAAKDCQLWRRLGLPTTRIAVNISPIQLRRPDFAQRFLQLTQPWACKVCGLDIEITESALLDHCATEVEQLARLRSAGIGIAIDDFGVGYSSLSRLSDLPIDTLKIDRSFISRLPDGPSGKPIVSTIITLAHAFGMTVVAEGVETAAQLRALTDMGCDQLQGYLLSRPLTADSFIALMQKAGGSLQSIPGWSADSGRDDA